jgi:hypothetical protein
MKIRLFKPKIPSNTEISIAVEAFNSPANLCLKGRTTAIAQMNIRAGKKRTNKMEIRNLKFSFLTS